MFELLLFFQKLLRSMQKNVCSVRQVKTVFPLKVTLLFFLTLVFAHSPCYAEEILSPNGRIAIAFELQDIADSSQCATYRVTYDGNNLVADSRLRFSVAKKNTENVNDYLGENLEVISQKVSEHDETWKPVYGERSQVRDHYRQLVVKLRELRNKNRTMELTFRAYDAGVAFRTKFEDKSVEESIRIAEELAEFTFLGDHRAWVTRQAQGEYTEEVISTLGDQVERPLTLRADGNGKPVYVAIAEAALVDYARMKLQRSAENPLQIVSQLSSKVALQYPAETPWRVIMVADSPGQLLENNDIILNLNEPCAIEDTSWIRPGKVIREITLTNEGAQASIEFAVKHHLQYVEFDAGWYGHEYDDASDATTITVDPERTDGPLALKKWIKEANANGLGVILYVNRRALEKQLDEILPLYKSWGVAGVKYGFVRVGSQDATAWLHDAVRKAADHQLMVDVHDEYRTTGWCRTYPNLMTVEGIRGDEATPTNELTLTLLFTRMLAGAADNKICYFNNRVEENQNHAAQLAKAMMMYDPWQFLFWYDTPAKSVAKKRNGGEGVIYETPELEFWDHMPTVWDDSRVLHGVIGQYAVIARKSGADWYVGALNGETPRQLNTPLEFLGESENHVAHIYSHDASIETRTHVKIERWKVNSETVLNIVLGKNSGQAIRIAPVTDDDDSLPFYSKH